MHVWVLFFFFSSRRRHTRCALVTGVQTCALPISGMGQIRSRASSRRLSIGGWRLWDPAFTVAAGPPHGNCAPNAIICDGRLDRTLFHPSLSGMDPRDLRHCAKTASSLLKAMGNERRFTVLCHLAERERSVGDLERLIGLSQSALSQHLARLRRDGIVTTRRNAQTIYYALDGRPALRLLQTLYEIPAGAEIAGAPVGVRLETARGQDDGLGVDLANRSEESRVGKEGVSTCRARWAPYH